MPKWQNWSGSVRCEPQAIHTPGSEAEIVALVKQAAAEGKNIRMVGSGHSFTPLAATDSLLLSLDRYAGLVAVNLNDNQVTVRAGTKISALGELLYAQGLAQENLGDIDVQSIAGAISTGTHGSGITLGSISTQVVGLKLITAAGEVLQCSPTEYPEVFSAARVSLGALGVISEVTLQCVPAYKLAYRWQKTTLPDLLENLPGHIQANRNFEFFWIPYTDSALVKFMNITTLAVQPRNRLRQFNENMIENGALWLLSRFARRFPTQCERVCRLMAGFITDGNDVNYGHRIFATVRAVKFNEMEYSLPIENFTDALHEIDRTIRQRRFRVHFPVECRFVRADDIPLSPANGRDSAYIAVHMYRGMPYEDFFDAMEAILLRYGGRPHWGKMHSLGAAELAGKYPQWQSFVGLRQRLDARGVFLNDYLRRIFGLSHEV